MDDIISSKVTEYDFDGEILWMPNADRYFVLGVMSDAENGNKDDAIQWLTAEGHMSPTRGCHVNLSHVKNMKDNG